VCLRDSYSIASSNIKRGEKIDQGGAAGDVVLNGAGKGTFWRGSFNRSAAAHVGLPQLGMAYVMRVPEPRKQSEGA
jgi:hypothetical protein